WPWTIWWVGSFRHRPAVGDLAEGGAYAAPSSVTSSRRCHLPLRGKVWRVKDAAPYIKRASPGGRLCGRTLCAPTKTARPLKFLIPSSSQAPHRSLPPDGESSLIP